MKIDYLTGVIILTILMVILSFILVLFIPNDSKYDKRILMAVPSGPTVNYVPICIEKEDE